MPTRQAPVLSERSGMKPGKFLYIVLLLATIASTAFAVDTTFWQVGSYDEFLQGTLTGLSLSRQGDLTLAPEAKAIFSPDEALALSLARDSRGKIYVGTGHQGKVFRVGNGAQSSLMQIGRASCRERV